MLGITNNYSPKWRWLVTVIYRATKRRGGYPPPATNTEKKSCLTNTKPVRYISTKRWVKLICSGNADVRQNNKRVVIPNEAYLKIFHFMLNPSEKYCHLFALRTIVRWFPKDTMFCSPTVPTCSWSSPNTSLEIFKALDNSWAACAGLSWASR